MCLFNLLLYGVFLRLEGQHGRVSLGKCVQVALDLNGRDRDQLGCHHVAHGPDILLILDSGNDTIEELGKVLARERGVKGRIKGLVGALQPDCQKEIVPRYCEALTLRRSSPSSTLCLNGPICTSRMSSGLR